MGAGLSNKQIQGRVYRRLLAVGRDLHKAGINTIYRRGALVFFEGDGITFPYNRTDGGFNISYRISRASNGEVFGTPTVFMTYKGEAKQYGFSDTGGTFEQGIAFIKENFAPTKEA